VSTTLPALGFVDEGMLKRQVILQVSSSVPYWLHQRSLTWRLFDGTEVMIEGFTMSKMKRGTFTSTPTEILVRRPPEAAQGRLLFRQYHPQDALMRHIWMDGQILPSNILFIPMKSAQYRTASSFFHGIRNTAVGQLSGASSRP
jgi:hypothetical protein